MGPEPERARRGSSGPLTQRPGLRRAYDAVLARLPTTLWMRPNSGTHPLYRLNNYLCHGTTDCFTNVEIETATACNRRCSYCPNSVSERGLPRNNRSMRPALFEAIVEQLAALGFNGRLSPHFYGEPLLDQHLPELLRVFHRRIPQARIVIFTNGDYLDLDTFHRFRRLGVAGFVISEHGSKMPRGVAEVLAWRRAHPLRAGYLAYQKFGEDTTLSNRGGLVEHAQLEIKQDCYSPANNLTIDHEGNVILCCNDYFGTVRFGNVGEEPLWDIWTKARFVELRAQLRRGDFELDLCRRCAAGHDGLASVSYAASKSR